MTLPKKILGSVIGYCAPNSEPKIFLGKVIGEIAVEEKGDLGFAFDPIFYVPNEGKTFGELTTEEKNQFSHRKNSLEKFIKWYSIQWFSNLLLWAYFITNIKR